MINQRLNDHLPFTFFTRFYVLSVAGRGRFLQEQVAKSEMLQATQVDGVEELGWKAVFFGLEGPIYLDVPLEVRING